MQKEKLDRINELSHLSKRRELTPAETDERQILREEYISQWRAGAQAILDNTYVIQNDGTKAKLKKKTLEK